MTSYEPNRTIIALYSFIPLKAIELEGEGALSDCPLDYL